MNIQGKVAVVTGGGSGIGRATALALSRKGAAIVIADLDADGAQETATQVLATGGTASNLRVDVSQAGEIEKMLAYAEQRFGGLDILCNNAGIVTAGGFPAGEVAAWKRVVDVNLNAIILATQLALPRLRRRGGGAIVQTASMAAFVGFGPDPVYAATKAAVVFFTHSLAYLKSQGIRVNCVCPGLVDTPLLQQSTQGERPAWLDTIKMLQAEEVAEAIVGLIEDDNVGGRALQILPGVSSFAEIPSTDFAPPS